MRYGICWPVGANTYCRRWSPVARAAGAWAEMVRVSAISVHMHVTRCRFICPLLRACFASTSLPRMEGLLPVFPLHRPRRIFTETARIAVEGLCRFGVAFQPPIQPVDRNLAHGTATGLSPSAAVTHGRVGVEYRNSLD